jgi:MYXO-CTERM domain-containing protein
MRQTHLVAALSASLLAATTFAAPRILNVQLTVQEQDQWCWAATSHSVLTYYGTAKQQCEIAEYARTHNTAYDRDFGTVACCTDTTKGCNDWNYLSGNPGSIQGIIKGLGGADSIAYQVALSQQDAWDEIDSGFPFFIRWGWDSGGGHFVVGYGYDGSTLYYMNPWPGEGLEFADYAWVVRGDTHTWTHSLTTSHALPDPCAAGDGTPCDDGNSCTTKDVCKGGKCLGSAVSCPGPRQCQLSNGCNPATGQCEYSDPADGYPCDDGDPCTTGDACYSGQCEPGAAVVCPAPGACQGKGSCNAATGQCQYQSAAQGSSCDDGDPCTSGDSCQSGACVGTPKNCPAPGTCQKAGSCDPKTGQCRYPASPDGIACDDGDGCTTGDACQGGQCLGQPLSCPAPDACHDQGSCSASTGKCSFPTRPDGTACDDGDPNTTNDQCVSGTCQGTAQTGECAGKADGTSCSTGHCASGQCVADGAPKTGCSVVSGTEPDALMLALFAALALIRRRSR